MKVARSSEISEQIYGPPRRHNSEGYHLESRPMRFPHRERPDSHTCMK